ncbi:hypothetical protein [Proteus cibi]|uniref:hypothetical protein n=1 Tax=Proteus cibi TaxID=2050966 RepID=UPI0035A6CBFD
MELKCPYCDSKNVIREVIGGQKSGDWHCNDCNFSFSKESAERAAKRNESDK